MPSRRFRTAITQPCTSRLGALCLCGTDRATRTVECSVGLQPSRPLPPRRLPDRAGRRGHSLGPLPLPRTAAPHAVVGSSGLCAAGPVGGDQREVLGWRIPDGIFAREPGSEPAEMSLRAVPRVLCEIRVNAASTPQRSLTPDPSPTAVGEGSRVRRVAAQAAVFTRIPSYELNELSSRAALAVASRSRQ
jgi:hypothetical protein